MRVTLRGGTLVDATGMRRADLAVERGVITEVADTEQGGIPARDGDHVIDARDRRILPGFVDAHAHADGLTRDPAVQRALLKQGVTTVIAGQDGVSYAPGDGAYATDYFAAINGPHPSYTGGGVAAYLAAADGTSRLNTAYLVPAGTVRFGVCGRAAGRTDRAARERMAALVAEGMRDGAVGLSTGLDYVPGIFADADEIAALCAPVAAAGGVYVTHMRGGYEAGSPVGIDEVARIAAATGVAAHISHFHAQAPVVLGQLDALAAAGVDATFDAYPYIRGCSLLGMPLLPPEVSALTTGEVLAILADPGERERLRRDWFPRVAVNPSLGPDWPGMITLAHTAAEEDSWALGLTLAEGAERAGVDPITFALDLLASSRLQANMVMAVRYERPVAELARIFAHPAHLGGSDGIFIGGHPHPRARGTFARFLREFVRETGTWSWPDAVRHLAEHPARRFGLGERGTLAPGSVADLIVVDPETVADTATYEAPLGEAVGIDDVLVAGVPVLSGGELVGGSAAAADARLPGRGLRRAGRG